MEGTVKWFNSSKGYGFIEGSDGTDYFAHFQEIQVKATKHLKEGAAVSFEAGDGEKGPVAKNIVALRCLSIRLYNILKRAFFAFFFNLIFFKFNNSISHFCSFNKI